MAQHMSFDLLFSEIRAACSDEEWSQAVELSRRATFALQHETEEEKVILVSADARAAAARVTLWPEACDWNCEDTNLEGWGVTTTL